MAPGDIELARESADYFGEGFRSDDKIYVIEAAISGQLSKRGSRLLVGPGQLADLKTIRVDNSFRPRMVKQALRLSFVVLLVGVAYAPCMPVHMLASTFVGHTMELFDVPKYLSHTITLGTGPITWYFLGSVLLSTVATIRDKKLAIAVLTIARIRERVQAEVPA